MMSVAMRRANAECLSSDVTELGTAGRLSWGLTVTVQVGSAAALAAAHLKRTEALPVSRGLPPLLALEFKHSCLWADLDGSRRLLFQTWTIYLGQILILGISRYVEMLWVDMGGGEPKAKPFL